MRRCRGKEKLERKKKSVNLTLEPVTLQAVSTSNMVDYVKLLLVVVKIDQARKFMKIQ